MLCDCQSILINYEQQRGFDQLIPRLDRKLMHPHLFSAEGAFNRMINLAALEDEIGLCFRIHALGRERESLSCSPIVNDTQQDYTANRIWEILAGKTNHQTIIAVSIYWPFLWAP